MCKSLPHSFAKTDIDDRHQMNTNALANLSTHVKEAANARDIACLHRDPVFRSLYSRRHAVLAMGCLQNR